MVASGANRASVMSSPSPTVQMIDQAFAKSNSKNGENKFSSGQLHTLLLPVKFLLMSLFLWIFFPIPTEHSGFDPAVETSYDLLFTCTFK